MKGMQKIKHGSSFSGAVNYVLERDHANKKDPGQIIGGNIDTLTTKNIITQLETAGELRPDIEKPVWHQSLRLPKNEHLPDHKWTELADEYMTKIGFTDSNPRLYVKHNDTDGEHIHIIASRINYNGQCHNASHESLKSTPIIHALEKKYGLTQTHQGDRKPKPVASLKKDEKEKALREQELPNRTKIKIHIDQAINESLITIEGVNIPPTFGAKDFVDKLEEKGVKVYPNISDTTGKFNGFSFGINDVFFKGSQIGDDYTAKRLRERGLQTRTALDNEALKELKQKNKPSYDKHKENETMKNEAQKDKSVSTEDDIPDYLATLENYNPAKKRKR